MASDFRSISVTAALLLAIIFLSNVSSATAILAREFDSMLETLRVRGYDLFCNAIVTSDLQFDVMLHQNENESNNNNSFQSFTFFAPTDSSLFALDMTQTASSYTDSLRYHVVPHRLSFTELRLLSFGYSLPTLLPGRYLNISRVLGSGAIAVSGVVIAFPGLFYGRNVAVHGLAGILNLRSNNPSLPAVDPIRSSGQQSSTPRIDTISSNTPPVASLIPESTTFDVTNRPGSSLPVNGTNLAPTSEPSAVNGHSPGTSPVASGDSPASSTEPPVHSHISTPAAPAALTPAPLSPEYRYSDVYLPPTEPPLHTHISAPAATMALTPTSPVASLIPESTIFDVTNRPGSSLPVNRTTLAATPEPIALNSHSLAISPVLSGDSPASSTEPPVHSHISAPEAPATLAPTPISPEHRYSAVYLPPTEPPLHSHISAPAATTALTPTPVSPEFLYSAVSSPPIGFSDRSPAPLGPDVWASKKDRVSLMETFTGGYERESQTVRFAQEIPETERPLAEKKDVAEESGTFDGILGCAIPDGFTDSTSRDRLRRLQCHYA